MSGMTVKKENQTLVFNYLTHVVLTRCYVVKATICSFSTHNIS